jgi:UDP-N-acetylglucosamine--N-acetylmuramyl-(pentapeptide) pyrophosphoryl-undecaprenol N-acetylglucosamine transferase
LKRPDHGRGTGAYLSALAVAGQLRFGFEVIWLGTSRGLEADLVPAAEIRLHRLVVRGLRGNGGIRGCWARSAPPRCCRRCSWSSDTAGSGAGYGGIRDRPGGVAACLAQAPAGEQNAVPGPPMVACRAARQVMEGFPGPSRRTAGPSSPAIRYARRSSPPASGISPCRAFLRQSQRLRVLVLGQPRRAGAERGASRGVGPAWPEERPDLWHQTGVQHSAHASAIGNSA